LKKFNFLKHGFISLLLEIYLSGIFYYANNTKHTNRVRGKEKQGVLTLL